ncbi:hypothetical protein EYF80_029486 [Liparis tanakae]|uniref:Uncharacterized protein n=1 Tax=Liparis tanakae TaxID=230148 RepID=A0A4Z2H3Z9_9TELE|nr:hypothetical protein EYF80_029486 [Liparis tanakae]
MGSGGDQVSVLERRGNSSCCHQAADMSHVCQQIEAHNAVMWLQYRCVGCKVSGGSRVRLDVDAPQIWVQTKCEECSLLAQQLNLVNDLCTSIVPEKNKRRLHISGSSWARFSWPVHSPALLRPRLHDSAVTCPSRPRQPEALRKRGCTGPVCPGSYMQGLVFLDRLVLWYSIRQLSSVTIIMSCCCFGWSAGVELVD